MEAKTLQVFLRVLYTVNSNPQYILARSSTQVPAIICTEATSKSAENEPTYARIPLKACLAAVCDSSPELLQDPARDFSLYVLDPLETQPVPTVRLANTPHNTSSPHGVAVALGLMSWALESDDSPNVFITGTIISHISPALEVVFALRETKHMPKPIFYSGPSLGSISTPGPSQLLHLPHPPRPAGTSWLSTFREQKALTRSADFPELYIGPPRRARGRPGGSTTSKPKVIPQARASSLPGDTDLWRLGLIADRIHDPGASQSKAVEAQSESKQEAGRRFKQRTRSKLHRVPPTHSPFICAPLTRHTMTGRPEAGATGTSIFYQPSHPFSQTQTQSHTQIYPQAQLHFRPTQGSLPGLLSALPSTSFSNTAAIAAPAQQAVLLSALQGLLAADPHFLQLVATNMGLSSSGGQTTKEKPIHVENNTDDEHDDGDSDIVILDSSAIDTTAFCKPSTWQLATSEYDTPPLTTTQEYAVASSHDTDSLPLPVSTPPSGQENTPSFQASTPTIVPEGETPTSKGQAQMGSVVTRHALDMPKTPTPPRARKRKLDEYSNGQAYPPIPLSSHSPSPSAMRTSSAGRTLTARQRVQSLPMGGMTTVSSPLVRLPSMLGSMRTIATNKSGKQSITLASGPSRRKSKNLGTMDTSLNGITSDTTSPKRRRTLNEFMAEHEARKSAKVQKRSSSGHKLVAEVSVNVSQAAPSQPAQLSTRHPQASPPRPFFRSDSVSSSLPASTFQPALVPGAVVSTLALSSATTLACATPSASTSTTVLKANPLKNFVLPAWARTGTAMLPRLSEEALARQHAEREAKKLQASSRRREAAQAKRRRPHGTEPPSKESSDEDEDAVMDNDANLRTLHPLSGVARSSQLLPPSIPSLPVFASDAVEPIPSSPLQPPRQLALPVVPSTPPRKYTSPGSVPHHTPSTSGSCSLFTPSSQDPGPLFTPSTPSATRSLARVTFTPRSPIVLHHSGVAKSFRKSVAQTPKTPKRNSGHHQRPRNLHMGGNTQFVSPSLAACTSQTQPGMGTRTFLLPPPSPCALRMPHPQKQVPRKAPGGSAPIIPEDSRIIKQESALDKPEVKRDKGCKEEDTLGWHDLPLAENTPIPPIQCSPTRPAVDDGQGTGEPHDTTSNGDACQADEEYASSPLPPSSPLPTSAFSSPGKRRGSNFDTTSINNVAMPISNIPLLSASDSDEFRGAADITWLPDGPCTAPWLTDSEASAWLTETEAWLTDTEGGLHLADSDAAWLSDSDAVLGDTSSFPLSSSNWLSDDADVDTDGEFGTMEGQGGGFDTAVFGRAFGGFVAHGRQGADTDDISGDGAMHYDGVGEVGSEFWASIQPPLGGGIVNAAGGTVPGDASGPLDQDNVVQDVQKLFDSAVGI